MGISSTGGVSIYSIRNVFFPVVLQYLDSAIAIYSPANAAEMVSYKAAEIVSFKGS